MLGIFLDTETTGRDPAKHRILEIAYRVFDLASLKPVLSYESIVRQPAEVWAEADPESLSYNGFAWEEVLKGKTERAVEAEILFDFNQLNFRERSGVFICQNPAFDYAFFLQIVHADLQRELGWPYHWLDLASMYFAKRKGEEESFKQLKEKDLSKDQIAAFYGIESERKPHRAMGGVDHLIACYKQIFS